jgi:hypothetical protein
MSMLTCYTSSVHFDLRLISTAVVPGLAFSPLGLAFSPLGLVCSRDLVCIISRICHFNLYYSMSMLTCYTSSVHSYLFAIAGLIRRRRCLRVASFFTDLSSCSISISIFTPPICYHYRWSLKITLPYTVSYSIGGGKSVS